MEKEKENAECVSEAESCECPKAFVSQDLLADTPDAAGSVLTKFLVAGMDCGDEVTAIRNALMHPQVLAVTANLMTASVEIRHFPSLSKEFLRQKIEKTGVRVASETEPTLSFVNRGKAILVACSGALLAVGFLVAFFITKVSFLVPLLFGISTVTAGVLIFPKAWRSILQRQLDMNVLMIIAVMGAFAIKEYSEAATVVFLFSLAELLEAFSVGKARAAIRDVLGLTPSNARLIQKGGSTIEIPVREVKIGDSILIKSGERIPVDGSIAKGSSLVNQAPLTGESVPVEKTVGSKVFAGTINETGVLEVRSTSEFKDSKVSQIIRLIDEAQKSKAPSEKFVDSFAKIYTPVVFLIAILTFMIPPLVFGGIWHVWFYRALVLLVIACPCALVISTPVSIVSGLVVMAKRGVLVKGGIFLENMGKIKALAVDKTGTITEGRPSVKSIIPWNGLHEAALIEVAASIEVLSSHPLAKAVVDYAKQLKVPLKEVTDYRTIVGKGAEAKIDGHEYFLGNHRFAHELGVCSPELEVALSNLEQQTHSVIVVGHRPHHGCTGEVLGIIALGDGIRENAKRAIESLRKVGIEKVIMLSGDNQRIASAIAFQVGIDEAVGDLLPDDKVRYIKSLVEKYGSVAMIGDGINDAPALAQATVGIAMGGVGTDSAIETSDITLMQDDLGQVVSAIRMGQRVLSVIRFNIGFALTTKLIFLSLAIVGFSNLWLAVAADMGASLLVIFNALRLLREDATVVG